jgi:Arc/MetJ-type ribon-helix-helix transcriptional regulator
MMIHEDRDSDRAGRQAHSVDLTPDLENAIRRRVDSGAYKSDVEVIRTGLSHSETHQDLPAARRMVGFAEFTIGPAKGRTRWLNPPYDIAVPTP